MKGSRNHPGAFVGALEISGETSEAQYLTQPEIDEILDSEWKPGPFEPYSLTPVRFLKAGRGVWSNQSR